MARLLIADDHPIFVDGLRQFLVANDHSVESVADNARSALDKLALGNPDMLVLDVGMSGGGGLHVLRTLRAAGNDIPVIFLTVGMPAAATIEAIDCGVSGIVLKTSNPTNLLTCIAAVGDGDSWIEPTIIEPVLRRSIAQRHDDLIHLYGLTTRQAELVRLVGSGLRNREIAQQCGLTEGTVKIHLHNIFAKLGVGSRAQVIVMLAEEGRSAA
jgi:two-component system nitrate/nitrite response regulator NarP